MKRSSYVVYATAVILFAAGCRMGDTLFGYPWSFQLEFPASKDLGELWLIEDVNCFTCGTGEKDLGRATGTHKIRLPAGHWFVSLRMPKVASVLMGELANSSLTNIGELNLEGSDISDDDLKNVANINLMSINLNRTKITGAGLKYLKPNRHWLFVNLQDCPNLEPDYLSHFRGWKRSTITVKGRSNESNEGVRLLALANTIICDGQPENVCGVQIR